MNFLELAKQRHSVRNFERKDVSAEDVRMIVEAAHVAPTAANRQPIRLLVAQDPDTLGRLSKAADIYGAPLAILVCADQVAGMGAPIRRQINI